MSEVLESLQKLGLASYADSLIAEGFDTWETLSDITESDLVIAEHRRQLESQGAPLSPLNLHNDATGTTLRQSVESVAPQTAKSSGDSEEPVRTKRKYRRHPKPDIHAPERPPSAYVIFSNHMREILKDRERSFTEMAKCVGERWQELPPDERERFERQASTVKERYLSELTEYKKTDNYRVYQVYLVDFKAKNGRGEAEVKRAKLSNESSVSTQSSHDASEPSTITRTKSGGSSYTVASTPPESEPPPLEDHQQQQADLHHNRRPSPPRSFYPKIQYPERRTHRYRLSSSQQPNSPPLPHTLPYDRTTVQDSYHHNKGGSSPPLKHKHSPQLDTRARTTHIPGALAPYAAPSSPVSHLPSLATTTADQKPYTRALHMNAPPLYAPHDRHHPSSGNPKNNNNTTTTTTTLPSILDLDAARSRRILPAPVRIFAGSSLLRDLSPAPITSNTNANANASSASPSTPILRAPFSMGLGSGRLDAGGGIPTIDESRASSSLAALLRAGEELAARDEGILAAADRSVGKPP